MKDELMEKAGMLLLRKGFTVKCLSRNSFDIVARNGGRILIIKVLQDANSISSELAGEMARIASFLSAAPVIIAEKAGEMLEDGVVYFRFGVCTVSLGTFESCLNNRLPFAIRNQSGLAVSLSGKRLSGIMEEKGYSLAALSRRIGVSRQMIIRYRNEKSDISIRKAEEMQKVLGDSIFERVDIFSSNEQAAQQNPSMIARKYETLGFSAADTKKAPFDIIAKRENEIILTEVGDRPDPELIALTKLIDAGNLIIFEKRKLKEKSIPSLSREEFLDMETASELIKFLKEFV